MYFVIYHTSTSKYLINYYEKEWRYAVDVNSATILKEHLTPTPEIPKEITPESIIREVEMCGICVGIEAVPVSKSELQAHEVRVQFVKML
jgi:hypothetical protein